MPLRDHFRPPLDNVTSWDGFYGGWPMMIVRALSRTLPERYASEPRVYLGPEERTGPPEEAEYEVLIYDRKEGRHLVSAIEFVSPLNKDRPAHRQAFVAKCLTLLQKHVAVAIIDLVTTHDFNLYRQLLEAMEQTDPAVATEPPPLYATACRMTKKAKDWHLETWAYPLTLGQPLPTLPLWLADNLAVPLELEPCYEETCSVLRIP